MDRVKKSGKKYKIINDPVFQKLVTTKIIAPFKIPPKTKIKYGLAAGKVYSNDVQSIKDYFKKKPDYILITLQGITEKLIQLGKNVYLADEVTMTIKLLRNAGKLKD